MPTPSPSVGSTTSSHQTHSPQAPSASATIQIDDESPGGGEATSARVAGCNYDIQHGSRCSRFFNGVRQACKCAVVGWATVALLGGFSSPAGVRVQRSGRSLQNSEPCADLESAPQPFASAMDRWAEGGYSQEERNSLLSRMSQFRSRMMADECQDMRAQGLAWLEEAEKQINSQQPPQKVHRRVKRVVNGDLVDVKANSHKAVVRVLAENGDSCTGTVVAKNKVLTAAHCVVEDSSVCTKPSDFMSTSVSVGDKTYHCELSIPDIKEDCVQWGKRQDIGSNEGEKKFSKNESRTT